ncbi:MAG: putative sulfate exporter family transporter [Alphaproteobacteria bacterium]|nr:putative sulfate exporter family transporter [Alphaproteobacteria bacterium]
MVYTRKSPALTIIGLILLAHSYLVKNGQLEAVVKYLSLTRAVGEMTQLSLIFGGIALVVGLWHWFADHKEGDLDYYLGSVAGGIFILFVAMIVKWYFDPLVAQLSREIGPVIPGRRFIHDVFGLNYVVLGIVLGMVIVNVFKIPEWAQHGVRLSRLGLKTGVILLGTLYSFRELVHLGQLSVVMIGVFVLGSVWLVLLIGARRKIPNSMGGVLSAGVGVCGVSAAVAAAPVVQAKSEEIAYTIGTILVFGVICMFLFPVVGHLLGMGYVQFGAWAGTGILNSAQVAGAALAFQPNGIETLKVAEIFNITRVLFLPIIVLWLAVWYVKRETEAGATNLVQVDTGKVIIEKFPVFVLGFIAMFLLSSTGVFAPAQHYQGRYFDNTNVSGSRLLNDAELTTLRTESAKLQRDDQKAALGRLIDNKKVMSIADSDVLRGIVSARTLAGPANAAITKANGAVFHTAKMIAAFRDWLTWLFAFGLTGLGMQITIAAMRQAGGEPLVIGSAVGVAKAVLSLIVVVMLVRETI